MYETAAQCFRDLGIEIVDNLSDDQFGEVVREAALAEEVRRISVDVSSLNRRRIAHCVDLLKDLSKRAPESEVTYYYSPSKFVPPSDDITQNESIGPVGPAYSGQLLYPERPPVVIVGLGYETGKALGAVEFLQAGDVWLFVPQSNEPRFEREVLRANASLIDLVTQDRLLTYRVEDPEGTYVDLCSLLRGVSASSNAVLLPLGPKVFSLTCMLTSRVFPTVSVWRASGGRHDTPIYREADGGVIGTRVILQ